MGRGGRASGRRPYPGPGGGRRRIYAPEDRPPAERFCGPCGIPYGRGEVTCPVCFRWEPADVALEIRAVPVLGGPSVERYTQAYEAETEGLVVDPGRYFLEWRRAIPEPTDWISNGIVEVRARARILFLGYGSDTLPLGVHRAPGRRARNP